MEITARDERTLRDIVAWYRQERYKREPLQHSSPNSVARLNYWFKNQSGETIPAFAVMESYDATFFPVQQRIQYQVTKYGNGPRPRVAGAYQNPTRKALPILLFNRQFEIPPGGTGYAQEGEYFIAKVIGYGVGQVGSVCGPEHGAWTLGSRLTASQQYEILDAAAGPGYSYSILRRRDTSTVIFQSSGGLGARQGTTVYGNYCDVIKLDTGFTGQGLVNTGEQIYVYNTWTRIACATGDKLGIAEKTIDGKWVVISDDPDDTGTGGTIPNDDEIDPREEEI
jgi:hypothetical protein